jgi:hypothetical protein
MIPFELKFVPFQKTFRHLSLFSQISEDNKGKNMGIDSIHILSIESTVVPYGHSLTQVVPDLKFLHN